MEDQIKPSTDALKEALQLSEEILLFASHLLNIIDNRRK